MQYAAKYTFTRHNAITDLIPDSTALMTFLANLRNLKPCLARMQARPYGQVLKAEPLGYNILTKSTERHVNTKLTEILDFLQT